MSIVAHTHRFVVGVDTHARSHTLAVVVAGTGELVAIDQFPATDAGMSRAIAWADRRTGGQTGDDPATTLWVIEGIGSYGALLAAAVDRAGYQVVEAPRMDPRGRHGTGKSDPLDAHRIAVAVLALQPHQLRHPRRDDGTRAAVQILLTARDQMTTERAAAVNALTALLRTTGLGVDARKPLTSRQITDITHWRDRNEDRNEDLATATARAEAVRLARRVTDLDRDLAANQTRITDLIRVSPAAPLLDQPGIGPVTAAVVLAAWSHPGRLHSEAAFAALAGVNPIPASSGNTTRHRLNRGGDRRLNRALHMAIVTRMAHHPETRDYVNRRRAEGRTTKEIRRSLKRYLARQLYRQLQALHTQPRAA